MPSRRLARAVRRNIAPERSRLFVEGVVISWDLTHGMPSDAARGRAQRAVPPEVLQRAVQYLVRHVERRTGKPVLAVALQEVDEYVDRSDRTSQTQLVVDALNARPGERGRWSGAFGEALRLGPRPVREHAAGRAPSSPHAVSGARSTWREGESNPGARFGNAVVVRGEILASHTLRLGPFAADGSDVPPQILPGDPEPRSVLACRVRIAADGGASAEVTLASMAADVRRPDDPHPYNQAQLHQAMAALRSPRNAWGPTILLAAQGQQKPFDLIDLDDADLAGMPLRQLFAYDGFRLGFPPRGTEAAASEEATHRQLLRNGLHVNLGYLAAAEDPAGVQIDAGGRIDLGPAAGPEGMVSKHFAYYAPVRIPCAARTVDRSAAAPPRFRDHGGPFLG